MLQEEEITFEYKSNGSSEYKKVERKREERTIFETPMTRNKNMK